MQKFILVKLVGRYPQSAVYKMSFDGWKFYIGGTTNIRQRMWGWKFKLSSGERKNIDMLEVFQASKIVKFEIIEFVKDPTKVKEREDFYIKENWGDPLLLNRALSAFSNKGLTQSTKKKKSLLKMQPVAKVDGGGNIIEKYESVAECQRVNGLHKMSEVFRKQGLTIKGGIYRKLDKNGNIINPPFIPNKPRPSGYKISEKGRINLKLAAQKRKENGTQFINKKDRKPISQFSKDGQFIKTFPSIGEAARAINLNDHKRLRKALNGRKGKSVYGFVFKYAEK